MTWCLLVHVNRNFGGTYEGCLSFIILLFYWLISDLSDSPRLLKQWCPSKTDVFIIILFENFLFRQNFFKNGFLRYAFEKIQRSQGKVEEFWLESIDFFKFGLWWTTDLFLCFFCSFFQLHLWDLYVITQKNTNNVCFTYLINKTYCDISSTKRIVILKIHFFERGEITYIHGS